MFYSIVQKSSHILSEFIYTNHVKSTFIVNIIINMDLLQFSMHLDELKQSNWSLSRDDALLQKRHIETFPSWLSNKVHHGLHSLF